MSYKVKLDIFEGPFDLLVYLIEKSGVNIYDVNISEITDQYLDYVEKIEILDTEAMAEFMLLASTLIQIKSAMLLPREDDCTSEEEEDPRDELASRIREYKYYKIAAAKISQMIEDASDIMTKPKEDISQYTDAPIEYLKMDINKLIGSFKFFVEKRKREAEVRKRYEKIERERMSMEDRTIQLVNHLKKNGRSNFYDLTGERMDQYHIVLTFVTVLEMMSRHMLLVRQDENFGMIYIELGDELGVFDEQETDNESA